MILSREHRTAAQASRAPAVSGCAGAADPAGLLPLGDDLARVRLLLSFLPSGEAVEEGVKGELESGLVIGALAEAGRLGDERQVTRVELGQGGC
jgi:hypothetical protein